MKTRYKTGRFNQTVTVCPGDTLNLTVREPGNRKQKVSENITIEMTITHWVMFYVPGVGFGGMFGGPDIATKMPEIFVNPELVNEEDMLIG
jgi:hypothetical protein